MRLHVPFMLAVLGLLLPAGATADSAVTRDEFKAYVETQLALQDPRVQKMPEARRIPEIARVNFKMKGPALQAILDKVEAAGGSEGMAKTSHEAIEKALGASKLKDRVQEIQVDTGSAHVVTYVKWKSDGTEVVEEAVLLSMITAKASPITSTVYLWAIDEEGEDLWRAKIGADRTRHVREDRIADWAKTRYLRLFEIDLDEVSKKKGAATRSEPQIAP